jgi:predicted nucleic acid-binding protein
MPATDRSGLFFLDSNILLYCFYDALILTATIEMDCALLLSEDLQDGRQIHGVTIQNPFAGL